MPLFQLLKENAYVISQCPNYFILKNERRAAIQSRILQLRKPNPENMIQKSQLNSQHVIHNSSNAFMPTEYKLIRYQPVENTNQISVKSLPLRRLITTKIAQRIDIPNRSSSLEKQIYLF